MDDDRGRPGRTALGALARRLPVGELDWDDLVVERHVRDELEALVARAALGGLVTVFHGRPGVGKTFATRVWAETMRLDLWAVDCALLLERHGAATASRGLDETLALGLRPHAVLLYDRADRLFDPTAAGAGTALLERAATRRPPIVLELQAVEADALPPEVARLPAVSFPFPDAQVRRRHWGRLVSRASPLSRPDLDVLAELAVPGAVIDAAVRQVVLASGDERLETETLLAAARSLAADPTPS